jgi:hypothetical protein
MLSAVPNQPTAFAFRFGDWLAPPMRTSMFTTALADCPLPSLIVYRKLSVPGRPGAARKPAAKPRMRRGLPIGGKPKTGRARREYQCVNWVFRIGALRRRDVGQSLARKHWSL